jgi:hypothetical protein
MTSTQLDDRLGASVFVKCESFQRVGAFKFRGAYNAISRIPEEDRERGVLTYSSGNHAQAVALACRLLGISATIVMPTNAPRVKRAATEGYGARIVEYDPATAKREEIARAIQKEASTLVPPFDHRTSSRARDRGDGASKTLGRSTFSSFLAAAVGLLSARRSGATTEPAMQWGSASSRRAPTTRRAPFGPERFSGATTCKRSRTRADPLWERFLRDHLAGTPTTS